LYEQLSFIYRLKLYALFINGKTRLSFINSDFLYCGALEGRYDCIMLYIHGHQVRIDVSDWLLLLHTRWTMARTGYIYIDDILMPLCTRPTRLEGFYSIISLKQQSTCRHIVAPLQLIIQIPNQPVFVLTL
jgi:hypothetical protein